MRIAGCVERGPVGAPQDLVLYRPIILGDVARAWPIDAKTL
jgi:hypothetical protein